MTDSAKPTREERLAAQLRANLRRRKAQGRALAANAAGPAVQAPDEAEPHLPKATPPR